MHTFDGFPDAIVCTNTAVGGAYVYPLEYIDIPAENIYYTHARLQDTISFNPMGAETGSGGLNTDCENIDLFGIATSGTTTPYSVTYSGTEIVVQPNAISTDPLVAVVLSGILLVLCAMYVRRVFFS